ncbi:MAG: hypothetical protein ACI8TX_000144 [Hyphomicrobiaceae bacterium]|jgi:hypothetical protein
MIARLAALLIFVAMAILAYTSLVMDGAAAIVFSFVGHPLLGLGLLLAVIALSRRLRHERAITAQAKKGV